MCQGSDNYIYFPPFTIGGPTGDYEAWCDLPDCRWCEFAIVSITNGTGAASVVISGDDKQIQAVYDGSKIFSKDAIIRGIVAMVPSTWIQPFDADVFHRVSHSQKKVFARIDCGNSCYITIRFRAMPISIVPGPSLAVHPDSEHQINLAREQKTVDRLKMMGIPGYAMTDGGK